MNPSNFDGEGALFGNLFSAANHIKDALLFCCPSVAYNLLSIRRGGLQDMAQSGMSTAGLLHHSRHADEATLHRYLEWGKLALNPARERFASTMPWGLALQTTLAAAAEDQANMTASLI
jgi:hypothetical protein